MRLKQKQLDLFVKPDPHPGWRPDPATAAQHEAEFENMRDGQPSRATPHKREPAITGMPETPLMPDTWGCAMEAFK